MKTKNVGEIAFGAVDADNAAGWRLGTFIGPERVALLRKARRGEPLPDGVVLVVQVAGGYKRAEPDDIDWEQFDWYEARA